MDNSILELNKAKSVLLNDILSSSKVLKKTKFEINYDYLNDDYFEINNHQNKEKKSQFIKIFINYNYLNDNKTTIHPLLIPHINGIPINKINKKN